MADAEDITHEPTDLGRDGLSLDDSERRRNGLGIAAFVVSLLPGLLLFVMQALVVVLTAEGPPGSKQAKAAARDAGSLFCPAVFLAFVALGLSIGSLCRSDRKRGFGLAALVISACTLMTVFVMMVLGLFASAGF